MSLRRRLARLILLVLIAALAAPALAVLGLRWVDPPTSAFMLRTQWAVHGTIYQTWRDLDDIAPALPLAVVASEDQTFPSHHGFVWDAIGDALRDNLDGGPIRGASSITQQVAKNLFLWPAQSYVRKAVEGYITVWIELLWPKRRIMEVYLNIAQFDSRIFGAEAAASRFFNVPAARLTADQAALLAAVLPGPGHYDAAAPSAYVRHRQTWIRGQMRQLGQTHLAPVLTATR